MTPLDQEITDFAAGVFLRYFRKGILAGTESPNLDRRRDLEFLRAHWAISKPVRDFLSYVLSNRHEAQSILQFDRRTDDSVARGRIDGRSTVLGRRRSGQSSLIVYEEPVRSFNTGPNQVVAWVVHLASRHAVRLFAHLSPDSTYAGLVKGAMHDIAAVKRLDVLREPLKRVITSRRPGPGEIRDAARSRRRIYRHAITAYTTLTKIETGDASTLFRVLAGTLIAPLEQWRRFELAVAVGIGEAMEKETGKAMQLSVLNAEPGQPIIRCGRFALYWQTGTRLFSLPPLEPSELRLEAVLAAYGLELSTDRPDLVIVDEEARLVAAIVEVKYLVGDTASARFREAASQVVRYARGYTSLTEVDSLIRRSLIALSMDVPRILDNVPPTVCAVDFSTMQEGALRKWVRGRLLSARD